MAGSSYPTKRRGAETPLPPGDGGTRIFDNGVTATAIATQGREAPTWREGDALPLVRAQAWELTEPLTSQRCRDVFDAVQPFTLGIEEELMLVDPETLELSPSNTRALAGLSEDSPYRKELRAAQVEIVTPVCATASEACHELSSARARLVEHLDGEVRLLAAGTHPTSSEDAWGAISDATRYRLLADEYEWATRRTLVCGLHVHVAVGGAKRTLAVYNALRSYVPAFGALAANSPFFEGRDTGLCSIRTKLHEAFARAGMPPVFRDWDEYAELIAWGRRGGLFPDASHFWWDLRLHPEYGTIELRVADAQTRVADNAAIAALFHLLVVWLARRFDAGEELPVDDHFRLHENTWRAVKDGVRGWLVDCRTGDRVPTRIHLTRLMDELDPLALELGVVDVLRDARVLLAGNGAVRQRYVAARDGLHGLNRWLVEETEAVVE